MTPSTFNIIATIIFACAICHTFFSHRLYLIAKSYEMKRLSYAQKFAIEILRFLSEVEVIFGIWVVPLLAIMAFMLDWQSVLQYLNTLSFTQPLFVSCLLVMASSVPIVHFVEKMLTKVAILNNGSIAAWWLVILTLGPLMGSLLKETVAITLSVAILCDRFFRYKPSAHLAYATLAILFVNTSIGSLLTNFGSGAIVMIAKEWKWDSYFMFTNFGWKAILAILIINISALRYFRKEFQLLHAQAKIKRLSKQKQRNGIPGWVTLITFIFLFWMISQSDQPVIFVGSLLLFLGFYQAAFPKERLESGPAMMVLFFLSALVIHGTLQYWWVADLLKSFPDKMIFPIGVFLSAFNHNALITYLASHVEGFSDQAKYNLVSGVISGGGLTILGNAPNFAAFAIASSYFTEGLSPFRLFLYSVPPSFVACIIFQLF
jgi:hypothetical protein